MAEGNNEDGRESKARLLQDLFNLEFNTVKDRSIAQRYELDRAYFCVNCRGNSLTMSEVENHHQGHTTLRAIKCSWCYGYIKKDIDQLFGDVYDFQGVYEFKINSHNVYFPKSRKINNDDENEFDYNTFKGANCCAKCKHGLRGDFLYCSIDCKLTCPKDVLEQHLEWMKLKHNKVRLPTKIKRVSVDKEISGEESNKKKQKPKLDDLKGLVSVVMNDNVNGKKLNKSNNDDCGYSFRKRSRKGIPHRAPFY